jgi:uncharacterized protein (TIGR02145 family)
MKKVSFILSAAFVTSMLLTSCGGASNDQVWMDENLNSGRFRNGDPIPEAKTDEEWEKAGVNGDPAWCYYNNDPANGEKYGKLYNWYAVNDPRGLAPEGWHIPSDEQWDVLISYLGGEKGAGEKMKSTSGWIENGNGTNKSGFSGLPGGFRGDFGAFGSLGKVGFWWSLSERDSMSAWYRGLGYFTPETYRDYNYKGRGYSVRCLKD